MNSYRFSVAMSYDQFLPFYQGIVDQVLVTDIHGRKIQLHGKHFKPFLTPNGISGFFELKVASTGKFISLQRIN